MADLSGDLQAGNYIVTSTVHIGRRNLFSMEPGNERHIATLVSGSRTRLQRFDLDCDKIVRGLALLDVDAEILRVLKALTAVPANASWSPAEIEIRELACAVIPG